MTLQQALDWFRENLDVVVTIASAAVAVGSAIAARSETRAQRRLQQGAVRVEIDRQSLDWGDEVINVLAEAGTLASSTAPVTEQDYLVHRDKLAARLSALGDRGRLFFPNYAPETKGQEKDGAYKGHRPPILFAVIIAYYQVKNLQFGNVRLGKEAAGFLFQLRRLFVSELQDFLDPGHRNSLVERADQMEDRPYERAARLALDFDCRHPGVLAAHNDEDLIFTLPTEERRAILHAYHERLAQ
ncbi:MAG: hypothetical protein MRY64_05510 [Hyphomonadaceae bacterium]|nr:hypothetical protein [Hyphomonadaceae bacterium]